MTDTVSKLKELLEGRKVIAVNESPQRDSICELVVETPDKDCSSFTLFATDLGSWIGNEREGGLFKNVRDLFDEVFEHSTKTHSVTDEDIYEAYEDTMQRTLGFRCKKCQELFLVGLTIAKGSEYAEFFQTSEDRRKLAKVVGETYILNVATLKECLVWYE